MINIISRPNVIWCNMIFYAHHFFSAHCAFSSRWPLSRGWGLHIRSWKNCDKLKLKNTWNLLKQSLLKSTISQKLRFAQKKIPWNKKIIVRSIRIFLVNLATYYRIFYFIIFLLVTYNHSLKILAERSCTCDRLASFTRAAC